MATIDSLDIQIKSSAGSAKQDIEALAKALEKLSGHESVKRIVTTLSKLPPTAQKSEKAIKRLSNANKEAANSSEKHSKALDKQSLSLLATYEHLSNVFSMMHGVQDAVSKVLNDAIQWDGIQFRFGRAFGEDAEEVLEYAEKVSETLRINQQQFMQYSSMYGSLLSGFGMAQKQVTTISVGLTELSYDIWAAYNDRYKSLEDASEAIRSAITGEIEPIRNAGIALTEASMQEYLDSIGMASTSVEKLTEAQKSELRYAVMVNSAMQQGIVGTYAREMNTAEGAVRTLTQQLKTLGQAFGSLFIPILQKALPWVSAFVELITEGLIALGAMFGIEFQEIKWGDASGMKQTAEGANATADALGDAAKNAKAMKSYALGFDELNVINPPSDSGGAGAAGAGGGGGGSLGLDLDTLWDNAVFESASKQIDELKEKIKAYVEEHKAMLTVVGSVAAFLTLAKAIRGLNALLGITKTIGNVATAVKGLGKALSVLTGGKTVGELFPKSWFSNFTSGLKMLKNGHIGFKDFLLGITGGLKTQNFMSSAADLVLRLGGAFKTALTKLPSLIVNAVKLIPGWGWIIAAIAAVITLAVVDYDFTDIGYKIGHALGTALKKIGEWLGKAGEWIVEVGKGILGGIDAAWEWVKEEFDINNVFELILLMFNPVAWITKIVPKMIEIGGEVLPGLWQGIKDGWNNFWGNIGEFIDGFVQGFKDALGIHSPSTVFADIGDNIIAGLLNGITEKWEAVKKWFNETVAPKFTLDFWKSKFDAVRQAVSTKMEEVKKTFSDKWESIKTWFKLHVAPKFTMAYWLDKFSGIKDGFKQTIKNAVNAGITLMNKFIGWINEKLSFSWDAFEIAGKEIVPAGSIQLFTIPPIPRLEKGGFLEDGLFTMNRGEIAGKFNNGKSVVANNQQIVEGIAAGVYEAVVAAMNATSGRGEQSVNVYLDGKQIATAVEKRQSERGRTLMGNQLGYVY